MQQVFGASVHLWSRRSDRRPMGPTTARSRYAALAAPLTYRTWCRVELSMLCQCNAAGFLLPTSAETTEVVMGKKSGAHVANISHAPATSLPPSDRWRAAAVASFFASADNWQAVARSPRATSRETFRACSCAALAKTIIESGCCDVSLPSRSEMRREWSSLSASDR